MNKYKKLKLLAISLIATTSLSAIQLEPLRELEDTKLIYLENELESFKSKYKKSQMTKQDLNIVFQIVKNIKYPEYEDAIYCNSKKKLKSSFLDYDKTVHDEYILSKFDFHKWITYKGINPRAFSFNEPMRNISKYLTLIDYMREIDKKTIFVDGVRTFCMKKEVI